MKIEIELTEHFKKVNKEFIEEIEKSNFDIWNWEFEDFDLCSYFFYEGKEEFCNKLEECYLETEKTRRERKEYELERQIDYDNLTEKDKKELLKDWEE